MRKGFTILEILVVIAIIAILSGITFVGGVRIREKARKVATRVLIERINLGLNEYHQLFFDYPPSIPTGKSNHTGSQNLYFYLGQPLELEQGYDPATGGMMKRTIGSVLPGGFKEGKKDASGRLMVKNEIDESRYIIDAWGNPLIYRRPKDYPGDNSIHNKSFADVESYGPDGKPNDDEGLYNDDINNWSNNSPK